MLALGPRLGGLFSSPNDSPITGPACAAVAGQFTDLARALLPAVVVLEDADLVAEERSLERFTARTCR